MRKIIIILLSVVLYYPGISQKIINDPNAETRQVKNFHAIHVTHAFDVYITQDVEEAVAVSDAEIRFREGIKCEVKNGVLYISYGGDRKLLGSGNKKLKAYISVKQIDELNVSGACDVFISGVIKTRALSIGLSGASDLKGKVETEKLKVEISGASDITIGGNATQLMIEASGASEFKGYDLVSEICNVTASGASDITISVNKELSANVTGASDVRYKGPGEIKELRTSGSGSVTKG